MNAIPFEKDSDSMNKHTLFLSMLSLVTLAGIAACKDDRPPPAEPKGPAEKTGEKVDEAAKDTKDAVKNAADKTGDALKDAGR